MTPHCLGFLALVASLLCAVASGLEHRSAGIGEFGGQNVNWGNFNEIANHAEEGPLSRRLRALRDSLGHDLGSRSVIRVVVNDEAGLRDTIARAPGVNEPVDQVCNPLSPPSHCGLHTLLDRKSSWMPP